MSTKNLTIDDLAIMVKKGFDTIESKMALKNEMNARFDGVDERLERIEKITLPNHRYRIEKLELDFKDFKELLAIK